MKLLSTLETARRLDVSPERVRQLDPQLRPERVGGRRVYRADAVEFVAGGRAAQKGTRK